MFTTVITIPNVNTSPIVDTVTNVIGDKPGLSQYNCSGCRGGDLVSTDFLIRDFLFSRRLEFTIIALNPLWDNVTPSSP